MLNKQKKAYRRLEKDLKNRRHRDAVQAKQDQAEEDQAGSDHDYEVYKGVYNDNDYAVYAST